MQREIALSCVAEMEHDRQTHGTVLAKWLERTPATQSAWNDRQDGSQQITGRPAMINTPKVISVGNINADFQVRTERWPDFGEELLANEFLAGGGGKAGNAAFMARRLDAPTMLIGKVGKDRLADQALQGLRELQVDLRFTRVSSGAMTGTAIIAVRDDGSRAILIAANANHSSWTDLDVGDAVSAVAQAPAGSVLVTNFGVPRFVVERVVRAARMRGFSIVLDPAPPQRLANDFYGQIDCIVPNAQEAEALTGIKIESEMHAIRAGRALLDRGIKIAFVRLADGGCVMTAGRRVASLRPVQVQVVDKTGAGDAFAGALAVALVEKLDPLDAGKFALAAAHVAVTRYGAQPSFPNRAELLQMLGRLAHN
jgi:ribokinase